MDNKLCIGLYVLVIVIIIVGLLYKYSNKLEHFYTTGSDFSTTIISTKDIKLDDISGSIDKYNSVHIWGTTGGGKLYKLKAGNFIEDTSYGTTGNTKINEISTFISKDDRVSIYAIKNDADNNVWLKKLDSDKFIKTPGSLRTLDLAVSPNGNHSMYVGIGTNQRPYQKRQGNNNSYFRMGGGYLRLVYNAIKDNGHIFSLCKISNGKFYYYNGNLQKVQDKGWGWHYLNVVNKNIFDFKLKFKKDTDTNELCVMVLVYNNSTYNLCYKIFDVSVPLGDLKNNIQLFLKNPIEQSVGQNISNISKSDVILNDTGILHKQEGYWSMRTIRSLFDFEFDYYGNIHVWMLKQDKLSITYYTNSPGYTLPNDAEKKEDISLQNIRGSYITNKNEPSDNINDTTQIMCILEIKGIKCGTRNFQIEMETKQLMIIKPTNPFDKCLFKIHPVTSIEDDDKLSVKQYNKDDLPQEEQVIEKNDITQEDENKHSIEEAPIEEDKVIVETIEELTTVDTEVPSPEDMNIPEQDIPEVPVDISYNLGIPDHKDENSTDVLENEQIEVENQEIEQSLGKQLEIMDDPFDSTSNEIEEFSFPIDNLNKTEPIQLKERNDIYYEMYYEARRKAKMAKEMALSCYLDAKNIKNTYMLNDLPETDSDENVNEP